jgi:hypothetical protein
MINAKEAVRAAIQHAAEILEVPAESALLEELELSEDQSTWRITLSVPQRSTQPNPLGPLHWLRDREYKIFEIDSKSGAVKSMRIRQVDSV